MTFVTVVLPIFVGIAAGFILERWRPTDERTASTLTLYLFSPALAFWSMSNTTLTPKDITRISVFIVLLAVATYLAVMLAAFGRLLRGTPKSAVLVTSIFMNSGNYGLPVSLIAFGQMGFEQAVMFAMVQTGLATALAIYWASKGRFGVRESLLNVLRMPLIYATVGGLAVRWWEIGLPGFLSTSVKILGDAAVPMGLVTLGIQLAKLAVKRTAESAVLQPAVSVPAAGREVSADLPERPDLRDVGVASFLRLIASPLLGFALVRLLGIDGVLAKVLIVQSGMPAAVTTTMLAVEFDNAPGFTAQTVFATTLASLVTVSLILALVG